MLLQSSSLLYITLKSYFSTAQVLPVLVNVHPETLIITVNNLYVFCVLKLYFDKSRKDFYVSSVLFGFVCAMGVITKITFSPLILLPIILLPKLRAKCLFILSFIVFMLGFFLPSLSRLPKTFEWLVSLATHTGIYGTGKVGLFDLSHIADNFMFLMRWNVFLFVSILVSSIFILYRFITGKIITVGKKDIRKLNVFLLVVLLEALCQIILVIKHLGPHYLTPSIGLFGLISGLLFLTFNIAKVEKFFLLFLIIIILSQISFGIYMYKGLKSKNRLCFEFSKKVYEKYSDCMIIPYYRSSSPVFALNFANREDKVGAKYLEKMYPNTFFYQEGSKNFFNFEETISYDELKRKNSCLLLYGDGKGFGKYIKTEEIFSSGCKEKIHKIISVIPDKAIALYYVSQKLAEKGQFKQAFLFALKAREMGYFGLEEYLSKLKVLFEKN